MKTAQRLPDGPLGGTPPGVGLEDGNVSGGIVGGVPGKGGSGLGGSGGPGCSGTPGS